MSRITLSRNFESVTAQTGWFKVLLRAWILCLCYLLVVEDAFVGLSFDGAINILLRNSRKKCREAVVIVLTPFFEWMVMTPCTLNSKPEKKLSSVFDLLVDLVNFTVPDDCRVS